MIIYIHVPKTGGTSIRMAAAEHFGEDAMLYDYGPDAPRTSPIVRELLYDADEPDHLVEWIHNNGIKFISGHFRMNRYPTLLPEADLITWVRDPVDRVVSQHQHRTRTLGETRPLEEWVEKKRWRNIITRQAGVDPNRFAAIGVLERHEESIELLNAYLGLEIQSRHDNQSEPQELLDDSLRARIHALNLDDHAFVEAANARIDET